jgi:hypothetical protein
MDKAKLSRVLLSVLALGCWIFGATVVQAHDGPPRMQLSAERIMPGVELEIRGVNIGPEQPIVLTLAGGGGEYSFGAVMGDEHGDFLQIVTIPRETQAGAYVVRAFGPNRLILTAPLAIVGTAFEEDGVQRGQAEPLLAPLSQAPAAMPASVPAPAAEAPPSALLAPTLLPGRLASWPAIVFAGLVAMLVVGLVFRRRAAGAAARNARAR